MSESGAQGIAGEVERDLADALERILEGMRAAAISGDIGAFAEDAWEDVIPRAITALRTRAPVARPAWMPIESAPRDGTPILVLVPGFDSPLVTKPSGQTGWLYTGYEKPTHWMPLPSAPGIYGDVATREPEDG